MIGSRRSGLTFGWRLIDFDDELLQESDGPFDLFLKSLFIQTAARPFDGLLDLSHQTFFFVSVIFIFRLWQARILFLVVRSYSAPKTV